IEKLNAILKPLKNKSDRDFLDFFCSPDSFGLSLTTYVLKLGNSVLTVEYFKLIEAAYVDYKLIDKSQFYYLLTARNELNQTPLLQIFHENNLDLLNYYCFIVDAHFSNGLGQDRNHVLKLLLQERQEMECQLQQWNSQLAFNAFLNQHGYYVIWQDPSRMGYTYSSDPAPINTQMVEQTETTEKTRESVAEAPHENEPPDNQQVDAATQSPEAAVSEPQQETSTVASESKEPEALISAEDQAKLTACLKDYLASNNVEVKSERGKNRIKIVFSKEAVLAFDLERGSFLKNIFDHKKSKIILTISMQHISSTQTGQPVFNFKQVERGPAIEYMVTANKTNYQMFKNNVSLGNAGSQLQKEKAAQEKNTESNVQVSASESESDEGNAPKSAETAGQSKVTQPKSWAGLFASPEGHNKPSGNSKVLPEMGVVPMKK
ncbi:MAG: hypothetical protein KDH94_02340, partial [Coxiellaceae bacterium]|nr:hypothetical protein [Coxiellaceae bacterium]